MLNRISSSLRLIKENRVQVILVDIPSLTTELHLRGFDQEMIDSALRCLVHVHAVQETASPDATGVLAEDILNTYSLEVVQAASQLFLDTLKAQGREVFRVRWGCEDAAAQMEERLWENGSKWWEGFVQQLNERYLGFVLPSSDEGARVVVNWKLSKDLKWFSVEVPRHGWNMLRFLNDLTAVALKLDLAFEYREFGTDGVRGTRILLHQKAYDSLKAKKVAPPDEYRKSIRLWRFFSEYDVNSTDFVALMNECSLSLDDIQGQIAKFFAQSLTTQYRDGQYPPYFINDKKKKEFQLAVAGLLSPMDEWLGGNGMKEEAPAPVLEAGLESSAVPGS
jgi:hypothetical protein